MTALICYHSNVKKIYPKEWIDQYRSSILGQTVKDFDIYELEYSGGNYRIFQDSSFQSKKFPTFVHAMNYMIENLFESGYDCVGNTNVDDIYFKTWLEKMLPYIEQEYDLVSCNFHLFNEGGIYHTHHFDKLNIQRELEKNHNVICHPGILINKTFWQKGNRYIPEQIPYEDMELWKRAIKKGSKMIIVPEHLVNHRVHDNSVCNSENR